MSTFDINAFDFSAITEANNANPFEKKGQYEKDERFYTLTKDDSGNGAAIVAFLPDANKNVFKKLFKINTTVSRDGKKRFLNTWSPYSINQPCPFNELSVRLWNEGDKDGYKVFHPNKRYVANIKVLKDPACPENEGKIFLYEMSQRLLDKIQAAVTPSEQDLALGEQKKEVFNPLRGWVFKLIAKKTSALTTYDDSAFIRCEKVGFAGGSIYGDVSTPEGIQKAGALALDDIKNKCYNLNDLLKPEAFLSYDALYEKLQYIAGGSYGIPRKEDNSNIKLTEKTSNVNVEIESATKPETKVEEVKTEPQPTISKEEDEINKLLGL